MRALLLRSYDGPDGLHLAEVPEPTPDDYHVLLEVRAIGITFPDLLMTQGQYQHKPELPVVPGCEIAGVVRQAPKGSGWQTGDRASAFVWQGGYAELAQVPLNGIVRIPAGADFATAVAIMVNYHTVHFGLVRRGRLQRDETLLVLGAAGGIGTAGLQVGKGLGARVIGGVSGDAQGRIAEAAGADDVIVLREGFSRQLREMTDGRGVDVVLDPLGDWLFDEAIRGLAPEGRILVIGFAAGDIPTLRVNRLLLRNISAVGVAWGAFLDVDPALMEEQGRLLKEMYEAGIVRPHIGARYRFEEVPEALLHLKEGKIPGKAVAEVAAAEDGSQPLK